jgi:hypothetical protein
MKTGMVRPAGFDFGPDCGLRSGLGRYMTHARMVRALTCLCLAVVCPHLLSQPAPLAVERQGDHLRLSAPRLHFIDGAPLAELRDGRSVTYVFSVTLEAERAYGAPVRVEERVVVSYDLWEERFSVVRTDPPGRAASRLTAAAAETWCLDNLPVPVSAAPAGNTFVVKLACWIVPEEPRRPDASSGLTLSGLIDLLSRNGRAAPPRWDALSGPLRLADLKDRKPH